MFSLIKDNTVISGIDCEQTKIRRSDGGFITYYYFEMDRCKTLSEALECARQRYGDVELQPEW